MVPRLDCSRPSWHDFRHLCSINTTFLLRFCPKEILKLRYDEGQEDGVVLVRTLTSRSLACFKVLLERVVTPIPCQQMLKSTSGESLQITAGGFLISSHFLVGSSSLAGYRRRNSQVSCRKQSCDFACFNVYISVETYLRPNCHCRLLAVRNAPSGECDITWEFMKV